MQKFYKIAWKVLFTIFYPFITLFALLFIGLVNIVAWLSRAITKLFQPNTEEQSQEGSSTDWQQVAVQGDFTLIARSLQEIHFGPIIYQLKSSPENASLEHSYWSDFWVPFKDGFLLQRWPSIEEHKLEQFELVYVKPGMPEPLLLHTMPTFYWQVAPQGEHGIEILWEEEENKRLLIESSQLP